jgi:hypothetical protein
MRIAGSNGIVQQYSGPNNAGPGYDVLPGGGFVMVRGVDTLGAREIVLVQNFFEEVSRLASRR